MFYQVYTTKVKRLKQVFLDRADSSVLLTVGITAGNCKRTSKRKELKNTFPV